MPRIQCSYEECIFIVKGFCSLALIELDPEDGCLTYSEDPLDMNRAEFDGDEIPDENWEEEGYQEIENLEIDNEEDY